MKKTILICFLLCLFLAGCDKEDALAPSLMENDWADSLDLSNPAVKKYYEKYGIGLLTKFDLNRDLRYNMSTITVQKYWDKLLVTKLEQPEDIAEAITFFEESFFRYFTNEAFIRACFPKRLLLTKELILNDNWNEICKTCEESDSRVGEDAINSLHSIYSRSSFAFSVKLETIHYNEESYYNYKMDNFYLFLAYLFEINNFYDLFGPDFYLAEMQPVYGRLFSGIAIPEYGVFAGVYVEEGGSPDDNYTDKYWYWNKGFVSTKYLNPIIAAGEYKGMVQLRKGAVTSGYAFPDKQREVRSLLNQLLFMTAEVWDSYPDVVKKRFAILMEKMDEWGIDVRQLNPAVSYAFPRD